MDVLAAQMEALLQPQHALQPQVQFLAVETRECKNSEIVGLSFQRCDPSHTGSGVAGVSSICKERHSVEHRQTQVDNKESAITIWSERVESFYMSVHSGMEPGLEWFLEHSTKVLPSDADM